jgi:hypothetical protein
VKFKGGISNRVVVQGGLVKFPLIYIMNCSAPDFNSLIFDIFI